MPHNSRQSRPYEGSRRQLSLAMRQALPPITLTVQTETDKTGRVRGLLIGPQLEQLRMVDGIDRPAVVRSLVFYGTVWLRALGRDGRIVDGGDL